MTIDVGAIKKVLRQRKDNIEKTGVAGPVADLSNLLSDADSMDINEIEGLADLAGRLGDLEAASMLSALARSVANVKKVKGKVWVWTPAGHTFSMSKGYGSWAYI